MDQKSKPAHNRYFVYGMVAFLLAVLLITVIGLAKQHAESRSAAEYSVSSRSSD